MLKFLDKETVIAINRMTIQRHGGAFIPPDNVRPGQSLGFIEQIRINRLFGQVLYPTPYHQAAAYFFYIAKNHTFHDGNKRTALASALTFLEWNGLPVRRLSADTAERFVLSRAASRFGPAREVERIARWLSPAGKRRLSRRKT